MATIRHTHNGSKESENNGLAITNGNLDETTVMSIPTASKVAIATDDQRKTIRRGRRFKADGKDGRPLRLKNKKSRKGKDNGIPIVCWLLLIISIVYIWYTVRQHQEYKTKQYWIQRLKRSKALLKMRLQGPRNEEQYGKAYAAQERLQEDLEKNVRKNKRRKEKNKNIVNGNIFNKLKSDLGFSRKDEEDQKQEIKKLNHDMIANVHGGIRWIDPKLLPPLPSRGRRQVEMSKEEIRRNRKQGNHDIKNSPAFSVNRKDTRMKWEDEWENIKENFVPSSEKQQLGQPKVDYTKHPKSFPDIPDDIPRDENDRIIYPKLTKMRDMFETWGQDELDNPPNPYKEGLIHFNYQNESEMEIAELFRDSELPFKVYNVPEVDEATAKWTDEYIISQFDKPFEHSWEFNLRDVKSEKIKRRHKLLNNRYAHGNCQESHNNFFSFYTPQVWNVEKMGLPPTRNNDFTFERFIEHAKYADHISLSEDQPHYYWQSGVPREERFRDEEEHTFVTKDLPSWSSTKENFFLFSPEDQKGIQCRFGERGVTAATHYDAGRNMVVMVKGAKRYVLSPPNQCRNLGIITSRGEPAFRHSLLNFAHISHLKQKGDSSGTENGMSKEERDWLLRSKDALAIDTILKEGEVLYIPSHWFHYIISIQKSAQCNVRSGRSEEGTDEFGSLIDVTEKC